jgi:hypothetical protein
MPSAGVVIDRRVDRQTARAERFAADVSRWIDSKIDDAEAHALRALTETLKDTAEGRATIRKAVKSRSYIAAVSRLKEIADYVAGPSDDSLAGFIADAREAFLVEAFREWTPLTPRDVRRLSQSLPVEPTIAERRAIRRLALHGSTVRGEINGRIQIVKRGLAAAVAQAGNRQLGSRESAAIIRTWSTKAKKSLAALVRLLLLDSVSLADTAAQYYIIRAEMRGDGPGPLGI